MVGARLIRFRLFLIGCFCGLTIAGSAQVRVANPVHDLGDVFENGGTVKSTFKLLNPYRSDTIRIIDIETSCGCTAILTHDTLILPLTSIDLDVVYDPTGRLGLFVKSIELTTKTGQHEQNKLFLKITGNVIAENYTARSVNTALIEYAVSPIYFYPVTAYDTSYLDFNYIGNFVNELTYEIDFYQFTTIGFKIEVPDLNAVERIDKLLKFSQEKIIREFKKRGFNAFVVFFDEPIYTISTDLPPWAAASIRLYSTNFDQVDDAESQIKVSSTEIIKRGKVIMDYQRFALPTVEEVLLEINFESIESKLFLNGSIDLRGTILMPYKKSDELRIETAAKLEKAILKQIKETTGAGKKNVHVTFDSLGIHPSDKYQFILWDQADQEEYETIRYEIKEDVIVPPLLPTYRQYIKNEIVVDSLSTEFIHFWQNLILNQRAGHSVELLIESSAASLRSDFERAPQDFATSNGDMISRWISAKFFRETGSELKIRVKNLVHGPQFQLNDQEEVLDFAQFNYFSLIPIANTRSELGVKSPQPYMVNFDLFFSGVDAGAWGFQRFVSALAMLVLQEGYVELRIESSVSKIPLETNRSNKFIGYQRLFESQKRLKAALESKLIDPNRILFLDESVVIQGPEYDGTVPIINYRSYHYLRIIPEKYLNE